MHNLQLHHINNIVMLQHTTKIIYELPIWWIFIQFQWEFTIILYGICIEMFLFLSFHKKIAVNENITSKDEYGFESNEKIIINYEKWVVVSSSLRMSAPGYKNWVKNDRNNFEFPSFLSPVGNLEREASKRYFEFSRPGFLHLEDKKVGSILYLIFIYTMHNICVNF